MQSPHEIPSWSLTLGSIGSGLVYATILVLLASSVLAALSARRPRLQRVSNGLFFVGVATIWGAMGALAVLFATSRFEYRYVHDHSDVRDSIGYKLAAIWSGQEGSFLLWACCAALFGALAAPQTGAYRRWFTVTYAGFLAAIAGILAYETPFRLNLVDGVPVAMPNGVGLVPALQNYWVMIHPPTIFLGFGSLTVMACLAMAAMLTRDYDGWVAIARPWNLASLTLLGLGLCMGGLWAYDTLVWVGFWAWDPVENTSFVPWCLSAALAHGLMVQANRGRWRALNLLLGGLPFLAFVYGTFLTRSGLLAETSVHSFAQMDRMAHKVLLGYCVLSTVGFLGVWLVRVFGKIESRPPIDTVGPHREAALQYGVLLLACFATATAIGMSVPMIQSLANRPAKVVEEGLYHQVLGWFFVPLFLLLAIGPYLSYRGRPWKDVIARAMNTASIAFALTGVSVFVLRLPTFAGEIDPTATVAFPFGIRLPLLPWMAFLIWLCLVAVLGNVWRLIEVGKAVKVTGGGLLAHVGLAILLLGLVVSRGLERKADLRVQEGRPAAALEYVVNYADIPVADEEYWNRLFDKHNKIRFHVIGEPVGDEARIRPGQRFNHAGYTIEYVRPFRTGEPGMTGTRFGAVLRVGKGERLREIQTSVELGSERLIQHTAMVDGTTVLVPLRLDAATQELAYRLFRGFEARPGHYLTIASDGRTNPMVWPHIQRFPGHDFYFTLHPQVLEASDPVRLQPGETKEVGGFQVTYRGLETSGTMGSTGASFVANLKVSDGSQSVEAKPTLQLTPAGLEPTFAPLNQDFMIRMTGMDAATKAVDVQVYFTKPVYPIEVFIKPWTGLVWLGTGILTAGGLWAAWSRRARRREQTESEPADRTDPVPQETADAPVQAAEV